MLFIVVKIPFEFDNEIYALNSSSLKSRGKKERKEKKNEREIIVKVLNPTFSNFRQQGIFNDPWLTSSQQVRDGPEMNAEVHRERSECNGES